MRALRSLRPHPQRPSIADNCCLRSNSYFHNSELKTTFPALGIELKTCEGGSKTVSCKFCLSAAIGHLSLWDWDIDLFSTLFYVDIFLVAHIRCKMQCNEKRYREHSAALWPCWGNRARRVISSESSAPQCPIMSVTSWGKRKRRRKRTSASK